MRWRRALTLAAPAMLAGGCAQQSSGPGNIITGSISSIASLMPSAGSSSGNERLTGSLYRVMANDRRFADRTDRENHLLLKAAETTRSAGATHFVVVKTGIDGDTSPAQTFSTQTWGGGAQNGAYIRVMTIEPGAEVPAGAVSAEEIIHFFGPKHAGSPARGT